MNYHYEVYIYVRVVKRDIFEGVNIHGFEGVNIHGFCG